MATDRPASTVAKAPRSRLSNNDRASSEQTFLFEALRELAFETCLEVAGSTLRIGLAASTWQLEQARQLLEHFKPSRPSLHPESPIADENERVVALALHVSPRQRVQRAQGVITLRRDNKAGLHLDLQYRPRLDEMRARGARLVEVEQLAFDQQIPPEALIGPMIQALAGTVESWGATDILAECTRIDAGFYCGQLGFKRLQKSSKPSGKVLLHLSAGRIARLKLLHNKKPDSTVGP